MRQDDALSGMTDDLSPFAFRILQLDQGSAYTALVADGTGNAAAREILEMAQSGHLLSALVKRQEDAQAMLAGLWLWHDWLDQSHTISQAVGSATGSFWHAIMHRREADFSNSKYWYARCRNHPAIATLSAQAASVINPLPADKGLLRLIANGW